MNKKYKYRPLDNDETVGAIHDALLDDNNLSLASAYNDACLWIAELSAQVRLLETQTSSGFCRRDTSQLRMPSKVRIAPVDEGDAWLRTGVDHHA